MTVRSLGFLDLPLLPRFQRDMLVLDSARILTRGNPLGAAALLSYLIPRGHIYTAVASENGMSLMGQVIMNGGESSARLTFLAPAENASGLISSLLDHLAAKAGEWGAFHLLADVDERHPIFRSLRQAAFSMYTWQRVWKLTGQAAKRPPIWKEASSADLLSIQSLHSQIVPALLQMVDSAPRKAHGMVCKTKGETKAYVNVEYGPAGIWLWPLVHPDSDCVPEKLTGLLDNLPQRAGRPIYLCVRSYQAWLEAVLEEIGAEAGPRQAVMVRRLAKLQKVEERVPAIRSKAVRVQPSGMSRISEHKG